MVPAGTAIAFKALLLALRLRPVGEAAKSMLIAGPLLFCMDKLFRVGELPSMTSPLPQDICTCSSRVCALLVPVVKRHCRQSPGFGWAASEVTTMGFSAVPTACRDPFLRVKLAP